jgi:WhiB family transcriptional regulator, redox-sensing transcriptional regulator
MVPAIRKSRPKIALTGYSRRTSASLGLRPHMSWEESARCGQYDPEIFFDPTARAERRAKSICAQCPVRLDCLECALSVRAEFGVWGGLNGQERRSLLRRSRAADDPRREMQLIGATP